MENLFWLSVCGEKGNQESMAIISYPFQSIPIWLFVGHVVCNPIFSINPLKLYLQISFGLTISARNGVKNRKVSQPVFACSKLAIETPEQSVEYVQN